MAFESCEQIDTFFIQGQTLISRDLIMEKYRPTNAWYGVIEEGDFARNHGTTHTGRRLTRMVPPKPCNDWDPIEVDVCETNACDFSPQVINHGSESYSWRILQKFLRTNWFCLDSLLYNEFPDEEISHIEENLRRINRDIHEEFIRGRYINAILPANKWMVVAPAPVEGTACPDYCVEPTREGWFFETLSNGEPDTCNVRVNIDPDDFSRIALLSNDVLDLAAQERSYETDEMSWVDETIELYPLYLNDTLESNRLAREADATSNFSVSWGGNNQAGIISPNMLTNKFGIIKRMAGNFAHKIDQHGMRFYPDQVFNQGLDAYDAEDPTTWPRLFRVFPYIVTAASIGVKAVVNPYYLKAPFSIAVIFHPEVGRTQHMAPASGFGSATREGPTFDANFTWKNPDWECNVRKNKGFWMAAYNMAFEPRRTEYAYAILHRTERGLRNITVSTCPINEHLNCDTDAVPYCCITEGGVYAQCVDNPGQNRVQDTLLNTTATLI